MSGDEGERLTTRERQLEWERTERKREEGGGGGGGGEKKDSHL